MLNREKELRKVSDLFPSENGFVLWDQRFFLHSIKSLRNDEDEKFRSKYWIFLEYLLPEEESRKKERERERERERDREREREKERDTEREREIKRERDSNAIFCDD